MKLRARRSWLVALAVTAVFTATAGTATAETPGYVALGDSAAAGPFVLPVDDSSPGCLRSLADYPHAVASQLGLDLADVTCSSAATADMTAPQQTSKGPVAPQLDALTTNTGTVTLTIGANDIGVAATVVSCVLNPSCADRLTAGGHDQLAEKIGAFAPRWGELIDQIKTRAPNAKVYVVGYGTYFPHNGCWPGIPVTAEDANYIQDTIGRLDTMLALEAAVHGAKFIDIRPPSVGHDMCAAPWTKWFEGLIPTSIAAPLHPNKTGMAAIGTYAANAIQGG
ncbi:SGNH/GDSL hydrolase family protein [Amycolatopsis sp. NBC_00345]|uniref:SGNH/GDSL hydrolase family protein n=1 Tax=Amycolatopsis sp. NBC_00345 TaxID=2975955 RepID=UPI002E265D7A